MKYFIVCFVLFFGCFLEAFELSSNKRAIASAVFEHFDVDPAFVNNKDFLSFQNDMEAGLRNRVFLRGYQGGDRFIPILKELIKESGIPEEFLYLALVESNFSTNAKSTKKAMGIWQFMPKTARMVGLRVDAQIDERMDPIRSTEGAIAYLKYLHSTFGKWYLVAIAYNCGEGKLSRAIEEAGTDDLEVLLDPIATYIPFESRNYIRKILYVSMLLNDIETLKESSYEYLLNRGIGSPTIATIEVEGGRSLADFAESAGMSLEAIKHYNRHIKRGRVPRGSKRYLVHIPYENLSIYRNNEYKKIYGRNKIESPIFVSTQPYNVRHKSVKIRFQWESN